MSELIASPAFNLPQVASAGAGVTVRLREGLNMVSVLARKGQSEALAAVLGLKDEATQSGKPGSPALGVGPGRWLLLDQPLSALAALSDKASLSDQSDGYAVFEIGGAHVRDVLAKGVPLDLHPAVFTDGVAVTVITHIGAIVWQCAPDRFAIAVFRSYAGSFWHWLEASAAEFGLMVEQR